MKRRRSALAAAVVILTACDTNPPPWLADDLAWQATTILETKHTILHSPYSAKLTAEFGEQIDREFEFVAELFGASSLDAVEIRLVPISTTKAGDDRVDTLRAMHATKRHCGGYAVSGDLEYLVIYVAAEQSNARLAMLGKSNTIRHELTHLFCDRSGLRDLPRWLDEGIAEVVERCSRGAPGPTAPNALLPIEVLDLASTARGGVLESLSSWGFMGQDPEPEPKVVAARYRWALAVVTYLLRAETGDFRQRVERIAAMTPAELRGREDDWIEWMRGLDHIAAIEAAMASRDASDRKRAVKRIHVLGTRPAFANLLSGRFRQFAHECLDDPVTFNAAALYFLFPALPTADDEFVSRLVESKSATKRLLGLTLIQRRGGEPDSELVRRAHSELGDDERRRHGSLFHSLQRKP